MCRNQPGITLFTAQEAVMMKKTIRALSLFALIALPAPTRAGAGVWVFLGFPGFSFFAGPPVVPYVPPPVVYAPPVYAPYAYPYRAYYGRPYYRPYGPYWGRGYRYRHWH